MDKNIIVNRFFFDTFSFVVVSLDRRKEKGLMCTHFGLTLAIGKTFYCGLRTMAMASLGDFMKRDIHRMKPSTSRSCKCLIWFSYLHGIVVTVCRPCEISDAVILFSTWTVVLVFWKWIASIV